MQSKLIDRIITGVALVMAFYHVAATQYPFYSSIEHQNTHLAFSLAIIFLLALKERKGGTLTFLFPTSFLVLSLATTVYVYVSYDDLTVRAGFPSTMDVIVGVILIILALEGCRRAYGLILPTISSIGILYFLFGKYFPGEFGHGGFSFFRTVSFLSIGFSGIYGTVLYVSAQYIILFLLFGGLLKATGVEKFFIEVGKLAGSRLAGGAALVAVISSGLVGTVTGAPAANVAITGTFTIPAMKKSGMSGEEAGAIEAVASSGGVFMPPVMGGTAFLMAAFANVSYSTVCKMAIIPALLYYWASLVYCQISGLKRQARYKAEVDYAALKIGLPAFIIPVGVLIYLLVKGFSAQYAIVWAMGSLVIVALLRKETRGTPRSWLAGIVESMTAASHIGAASACIGLLVATITTTGLGIKLPEIVEVLSGGSVPITIFLTALVVLILGCGLPGPAAYVIAALVSVPVLLRLGLAAPIAHFFVFFYAALAAITPPIGMASLVASKIADAGYLRTGLEGTKVVAIAWLLPFFFLSSPAIIMTPWNARSGIPALVGLIIAQPFFTAFVLNHLFMPLSLPERVLSLLGAATLWGSLLKPNVALGAAGLTITLFVVGSQWLRYKRVFDLSSL